MQRLIESNVEVARELQVRAHVYPKLVAQGKLTQDEANRRMRALRYVLDLLDQAYLRANQSTPTSGE